MYSPEYGPPLTATTMYCLPYTMYVMGEPLCGAGIYTAPTSFPVALSYARNIAPRGCSAVVVTFPSPAMTSDLVTSVPMLYVIWPVRGMFIPFKSSELRTTSGVSPCAICQTKSPLSRLMAVIVPYGGLTSGRPSTSRRTYWLAGRFFGGLGESAPAFSPGPRMICTSLPATPAIYLMSETSLGDSTNPIGSMQELHAYRYAMCVSGRSEPPGQFVPPEAVPIVSVPSGPSSLLTVGGV